MNSIKEGNWRSQDLYGNIPLIESPYISNKVTSTRYSLTNLLPKNLFEQFERSANVWFLLVSIFQLIPFEINPVDSWTTIVPLSILIFLTLLKDAYNDYYRAKQDKLTNNSQYLCWNGSKFECIKSEKLLVGHIVQINKHEKFPADVVVLGSKNERNFFLDTSGISGETNLKPKKAVSETHRLIQSIEKDYVINKMAGIVSFEQPNNDFGKFRGKLKLSGHPRAIDLFPINLAYRGSTLHGSEWVLGIVIYTGQETKTYLNVISTPRKISRLEKKINVWVAYLLLALLIMVIFSVLVNNYLSKNQYSKVSGLESFVMFTILYNNIIPISLFVTMDMVRIFQVYFIQKRFQNKVDFKIGDINENLGQVEYILSDKTGTITENELKLQLCVIGNSRYFRFEEESDKSQTILDEDKPLFTKVFSESSIKLLPKDESTRTTPLSKKSSGSFTKLKQLISKDELSISYQYIKCLALCNTINVENEKYVGISLDEIAMIEAASEIGVKLVSRDAFSCEISVLGVKEQYNIMASVPFSSSNKKSRVLVNKDGNFTLFVKGTLDEILKVADGTTGENIEAHDQFASKHGLRTIVMGYKSIPEQTALEFISKIESARHIPVNSEGRIEMLFKELEKDLIILGLAGIEDIVLPETVSAIELLQKAGIKIWILSGDSELGTTSTARKVNLFNSDVPVISLSNLKTDLKCVKTLMRQISNLLFNDYSEAVVSRNVSHKKSPRKGSSSHMKLDSEDSFQAEKLNREVSLIDNNENNNAEMMLSAHPLFQDLTKQGTSISEFLNHMFFPNSIRYSMSIDRVTLNTALENEDARKLLCILLFAANSVCFYGLLPLDKAKIVKLVKENFSFRPCTLAIGDGNGDIPMIQAADVGIGVLSKENSQASNYSDICVQHFSQLSDLLLLHGHWNYSRMSRSLLLFFYKNMVLNVVIFGYVFFSDYSGVSIFSSSLLVGFNIGFTSLPILALGVFDEDLPVNKILEYPEIYSQGQKEALFNWKKMVFYIFLSIIDGIIIPLLVGFFMTGTLNSSGFTEDNNLLGNCIFIGLVFTVLIQIGIDTHCYSFLYVFSQAFSVLILAGYLWFVSEISIDSNYDLIGSGEQILKTPLLLISILIVPLIILAIHQAYSQYISIFHPSIFEKIAKSTDEQLLIFNNNRLEDFVGKLEKLYRGTSFNKKNLENDAFEIRKTDLHFNSEFIETQYREFYIVENIKFYQIIIVLLFSLLILWTILEAFVFSASLYYSLMRTVMCVAFSIIVFVIWTEFFMKNYVIITIFVIAVSLILKFGSEIAFLNPGALATGVVPAITYILFNVDWVKVTYLNILNVGLYLASILIYYIFTSLNYTFLQTLFSILIYMILIVSISATSAIVGYYIDRTKRLEYKLIKTEEIQVEKSQRILSFLLPAFVKKRVKDGARYIAEDQGTVTVLFCDIVDFDSICADYSPVELTTFLDSIFQKFDQLCATIGVTKIETVGKTYMACSGLRDFEAELDPSIKEVSHPRRAVELGISMIYLVETLRLKNGNCLQVKIGINTGPVTAGVVGYHKPQFSLVGDTVNTSSRMCSTLERPNSIQISKETYDKLENYAGLDFKGNTIEAKGKGIMNTFIVSEVKNTAGEMKPNGALGHLSTFMHNSTMNRTITDSSNEGRKFKSRGSELLGMIELNDTTQVFQRTDTDVIGQVQILDFSCGESQKQKKFRIEKTQNNRYVMFIGIVISHVTFSLLLIITVAEYLFTDLTVFNIVIARGIIVGLLFIVLSIHHKIYISRVYPIIMLGIFLMMLAVSFLDIVYATKKENDQIALEIMYIVLLLNHTSEIPLSKITMASLLIFIPWGILLAFGSNSTYQAANSAFVVVFALINGFAIYSIESHLRMYFNLIEIAEKEIEKTDKLLAQMMPPHVLENMKQDKAITDKLLGVTLLYADIVGFTAWSSNKTPKEVVGMLSDMFTRFDKECSVYKVYKVHTIGDCYVIMGYIGCENRSISEECLNVLKMAKSMINIIREINLENGSELNMRIGIHTGEVIAGITGTNIVRYDIYGPDVLIANKMESGGMAGKINVSDVTMNILESKYPGMLKFEFNKEIVAKIIGRSHKSYFLREETDENLI